MTTDPAAGGPSAPGERTGDWAGRRPGSADRIPSDDPLGGADLAGDPSTGAGGGGGPADRFGRPGQPPRFQVVRTHDGSGQSVVHIAWDFVMGRYVALKAVHPWAVAEARLLARMDLPGVIGIYELWPDEQPAYLVMQYAAGGRIDEREYRPTWRADPRALVDKLLPVLDGLGLFQERTGTAHRDIKPANLLLQAPGEVTAVDPGGGLPPLPAAGPVEGLQAKLIDFGLAREVLAGGPSGGTFEYADPRVWTGYNGLDVDVFGVGATLYALLAGKAPIPPRNPTDHPPRRLAGDPSWYAPPPPPRALNPAVAADLSAVVMAALRAAPGREYPSVEALADDLRRWRDGRPVRATGYAGKAAKWVRRNRGGLAAGLLAGLVALAVAGVIGGQQLRNASLAEAAAVARADRASVERAAAGDRADKAAAEAAADRAEADRLRQEREATAAARHVERVTAARTAARRGDWAAALDGYRAAVADAGPDAVGLRVERLWGYMATNAVPELEAELAALEREAPGGLLPKVQLVRGALMMCDYDRLAAGRKLVAASLAGRAERGTPAAAYTEADVLYAEALAHARPRPLIDALRRTVEADALHYPAQMSLMVALLGSGQLDAARAQAGLVDGLFPDTPPPAYVRALLAAFHGDRGGMRGELAAYVARGGDPAAPAYCELFADMLDISAEIEGQVGSPSFAQVTRLAGLAAKMALAQAGAFKPVALPVPAAGLLAVWFVELRGQYERYKFRFGDDDYRRLREWIADYPDGVYLSLAAANRFAAAARQLLAAERQRTAGDLAALRRLAAESAAVAERAAAAPSLLVRSPTRYDPVGVGLVLDVVVLRLTPDPDPAHLDRVRRAVPRLIADGRKWPQQRAQWVRFAVGLMTAPPGPSLLADWRLDTPAGAAAYRARNRVLLHAAEVLLDGWAADEPAAVGLAGLRGDLERWAAAEGLVPGPPGPPELAPPPRPKTPRRR